MKHLTFKKQEKPIERKTDIYKVINIENEVLGIVKWRPGWRQYIFSVTTEFEVDWSWDCLKEVSDFIKQLMEDRK